MVLSTYRLYGFTVIVVLLINLSSKSLLMVKATSLQIYLTSMTLRVFSLLLPDAN